MPLFLDGDAFLVYNRLSDMEKKDCTVVKGKLSAAFIVTPSDVYRQFVACRLKPDKSVDTCVADLQRLLVLSGHTPGGDTDAVVIEQFIACLSDGYAHQLRMAFAGKTLKISGCSEQVRALHSTAADSVREVSALAPMVVAVSLDSPVCKSVLCHHCKRVGHIRRNCPR